MEDQDLKEKIRQQFDVIIYPQTPIEWSPKGDFNKLFIHDLITSYYLRNQKIIDITDKVILDAGCGSGSKALMLAEANPGTKIIGIDISEKSIEKAKARLEYHGFNNVQFYVLSIEELVSLNQEFDYINCDDVLYLLPDITIGLQAMKRVLKPTGIIRANLHSAIQRHSYYCMQNLFKMMGLMDGEITDTEISIVQEMMPALKDDVLTKAKTWNNNSPKNAEWVCMNYLFHGDKGFTIPELFSYLREADLEFISMVNWQQWNIFDLFKEKDNLPTFLEMSLPGISMEEGLRIYELLNPVHRLLDFWCGHPEKSQEYLSINEWTESQWARATIYLHSQLKNDQIKQDLINCVQARTNFFISNYININISLKSAVYIEPTIGACLLPLWDSQCTFRDLTDRLLQIMPVEPVTFTNYTYEDASLLLQKTISDLATYLYVLLETS